MIRRPPVILGLGWLVAVVYAFPGQMTDESFAVLRGARGRFHADDVAPAMSWLWRIVELVAAGPAPILALQAALFVVGAYAILRRAWQPERAAWLAAGIVVFPPVLAAIAVISPATLAAALLVAGAGALMWERPWLGLAALFAATCVRESAFVATLPLIVLLAPRDRATWGIALTTRRQGVLAWIAITLAAFGVDAALGGSWYSARQAAHDIAGITVRTNSELPSFDGDGLTATYAPSTAGPSARVYSLPDDGSTPAFRADLAHTARTLAGEHPGAFVAHRAAVLGAVLWLDGRYPVVPDALDAPPKMGVPTYRNPLQRALAATLGALGQYTPLFAPFLWLALALGVFIKGRGHVRVLVASGVVAELSLALTATSPAYPQSLWLVTSVLLGALFAWRRR